MKGLEVPVPEPGEAGHAPWLSIVVPVLNEARRIELALANCGALRQRGAEVIVVDGGSEDDTVTRAGPSCDRIVLAPRGRARQLNAGARAARGEALVFLHADTALPPDADAAIFRSLDAGGFVWGRFDVRIEGTSAWFPVIARAMNLRSRWTGIATGDQAMFCLRRAFDEAGGFPEIDLMEDIELSARLLRLGRPACLRQTVTTSGRRWARQGILRTMLLMWAMRLGHFFGVPARMLGRIYRAGTTE